MSAQDQIPEEVVREALRPRRADADEFAAAVRRKAARRAAEQDDEERRGRELLERSPFLRQAASLLPPFLLPEVLVGAAGKHAAWKAGLAVVALPVFLLVAMAATLVAAVRAARALDATRDDDGALRRHGVLGQMVALAALVVVAVLPLTVVHGSADLVLGLLFASMITVLLVVRRLSRLGLASRRGVAVQCAAVLSSIAMWAWLLGQHAASLARAEGQATLVYLVLLLGGAACVGIARWSSPGGQRAALAFGAILVVVLPLLALLVLSVAGIRSGASDEELAAWVERFDGVDQATPYWKDTRDAVLYLHEHTELRPSLAPARAALDEGGAALSPFTLAAAVDMGCLRPGEVLAVDTGRFRRELMEKDGPIGSFGQFAAALWDLEATGALDDAARDRLADRLVATWFRSREVEREDLDELCHVVRSLDRLGRAARVDELRDDALAFLGEAWIAPGEARREEMIGGFQHFRELDFCGTDDEAAAVWLMDRLGVPPGVDLGLVARHLRREALRHGLWSELDRFDVGPAATLARFEAALGDRVPPTPLAARLLGWRLLIGTLLLVAMCLYATLRAPLGSRIATTPTAS